MSLLTRLRVDFSDLREHRFNHKWNCAIPTCKCKNENESTEHFFLRCPIYIKERDDLFSALSYILQIDKLLVTNLPSATLIDMLLYGCKDYEDKKNNQIIVACIRFIISTSRLKNIVAYQAQTEV